MIEDTVKNKSGLFYDKSILDDGIEFIGLINKQGKMEIILYENGINLRKERKEMFSMELRLEISMHSDFDSEFGPVSYTVTEREKSKFVSILSLPYIILIVMKKNLDHIIVIDKIMKIIRNFASINKESSDAKPVVSLS